MCVSGIIILAEIFAHNLQLISNVWSPCNVFVTEMYFIYTLVNIDQN